MAMEKECDTCTDSAEFEFQTEGGEITPMSCARHLASTTRSVIDVWGDLGPVVVSLSEK